MPDPIPGQVPEEEIKSVPQEKEGTEESTEESVADLKKKVQELDAEIKRMKAAEHERYMSRLWAEEQSKNEARIRREEEDKKHAFDAKYNPGKEKHNFPEDRD